MESQSPQVWINIQERKSRIVPDPVTIPVVNPGFQGSSGWRDNTDSWDVVFGAIYFNYVSPQAGNLLWQQLSGFTRGNTYTVSFDIITATNGYITCTLGNDTHSFTGNGTWTFDATIEEDESTVQRIGFRAQPIGPNYFNGGITNVSVTKNVALSPVTTEVWYQTKGKVYPVDDIGLPITYAIADVMEFGKSKGSRTKTVRVVADAEAERVFGHLSDISTTFDAHDPKYKHRCQVIERGQIVFEGFGRLLGVTYRDSLNGQKESIYKIAITDDAASFSDDATEFELSRLNLNTYDHPLTITSIMAKSAATYGDVFCYPTLWADDAESYRVKDFFPGFFFMDLWDMACDELGYSYVFSDPFVLDRLRQCVIPYAGKSKLLSEADVQRLSTRVLLRSPHSFRSKFWLPHPAGDWMSEDTWNAQVNFNTIEFDEQSQWNNTLFRFEADLSLDYTLDVRVPCDIRTTLLGGAPGDPLSEFTDTQTMYARLAVRVNGQLLTSVEFRDDAGGYQFDHAPSDGINGTLVMAISGETFSLTQGDVLTVHVDHAQRHRFANTGGWGSMEAVLEPILTDGATYFQATAVKTEVGEGSTIDLTSYLPALTFGDLINYARKKFNLMIYASEYDPEVIHFDTRHDFFDSAEQLDWTDRLDGSLEEGHDFLPALLSESFLFTDQKASDNFSKNYMELNGARTYGQLQVSLESNLAKGVKTIGPNKFASTPLARNRFGFIVPAIDARNMPSEYRVMLFSGATYGTGPDDGLPIKHWDEATQAMVTRKYPVSHCAMEDSFSNMSFSLAYGPPGVSIMTGNAIEYTTACCFERYWREYVDQVKSGKMFIGNFQLDTREAIKLKKGMNKLVSVGPQNYIINRVIDFFPNRPGSTKVELLLLPNFHGIYNERRTTVPGWSQTTIMTNHTFDVAGVLGPSTVHGNGNTVVKTNAGTTKSMVVGDDNFVGKDAEGVLVVGEGASVDAGVKNAAAIGVNYGAKITEDGQVRITDWVEVTGEGELVLHHWFMGGVDADHTGLDQFTTDFPVIVIGGNESEVRRTPVMTDDEQHWFIIGGYESATYPVAPYEPPTVRR